VFVGKHERQLDSKGRLALPAAFRSGFQENCFLTYGEQGCISVLTPEDFETMANETVERTKRGEISRDEMRVVMAHSYPADIDRQGRIMIPSDLRTYASLETGTPAVVTGALDRVEIWSTPEFEQVDARGVALRKANP
jgi:MraZ protein